MECPFVSVIVPVLNDARRLDGCLAALERQTYPPDRYEVRVVDNGSTDGSGDVVARFPHTLLAHEREAGSYAARNRGIALARGDVLCFTDADCIPADDWLAAGTRAVEQTSGRGVVGGRVELFYRTPGQPTACELYETVFDFDQERFVTAGRFAMTANLFTTAAVIRHVGRFDARLKSAGDREWGNRAHAAGHPLSFASHVLVRHPARLLFHEILAKRVRVAGGHHDISRRARFPSVHLLAALSQQLLRKPARAALRLSRWRGPGGPVTRLGSWGVLVALCWAEAGERVRLHAVDRERR